MSIKRPLLAARGLLALLLLFSASCTENGVTAKVLTSITVTLSASPILPGQTSTATATGADQDGAPITTGAVAWSSSNPAVATVNATSGVVTAVAGGTTQVVALAGTVSGSKTLTVTPLVLNTINVTLPLATITQGQTSTATAAGLDQNGAPFAPGAVVWSSSAPTVATVVPATGVITAVGAGTAQITATNGTINGSKTLTVTAPAAMKINEVESSGGTPGDWIEFFNSGATTADLSGWVVKDNDDTHSYAIPAGTTVAPGAYFVVEEAQFGFGLGTPDAARIFNPYGVLVDSYSWTPHAVTTYGRCPDKTGAMTTTTSSTKGAANDCSNPVRINEVESNGGTPGDWVELYNPSAVAIDLSGYGFKDNDDTHNYVLPAGSTITAGGYLLLEEAQFGFGLGSADAARLFTPTGALLDSYTWTAHAAVTYGRCPDGAGAFADNAVSTKGAANSCGGSAPVSAPWPGPGDDVVTIDGSNVFQTNLSGLIYEAPVGASPAVLWGARNGPGTVFRLIFSGGIWTPDPANGWGAGKADHYLDGTGNPDSEGITYGANGSASGIYVSTERNNDASTVSRLSVLRFDPSQAGTQLTATNDWNLTSDIPAQGANLGLEGVTFVPDAYLTTNGFFDEKAGHLYNPAEYANHGGGIFLVGVEGNGVIYAYALDHVTNGFTRVATINSGFTAVMEVQFDRELNYLWAVCDDGCGGKHATLEIDTGAASPTKGRFIITHLFDRPTSMPNLNNEGFAVAPQAECVGGKKFAYWADDGETGGHSIRRATISCVRFP